MSGQEQEDDMAGVDALFEQARAEAPPQPSDALLSRIAQDAAQWQPQAEIASKPGLFAQLFEAVGGWPAIGGLATATVAGVYLGIVQPDLVNLGVVAETEFDLGASAIFPDDTLFFEEG